MEQTGPRPADYLASRVLRRNLRRLRKARGWSHQQLADRISGLGGSLSRTAIWKIENPDKEGGGRKVSLDEAVELAVGLGVALIYLVTPWEADESFDLTEGQQHGGISVRADLARAWIRGEHPIPLPATDTKEPLELSERGHWTTAIPADVEDWDFFWRQRPLHELTNIERTPLPDAVDDEGGR